MSKRGKAKKVAPPKKAKAERAPAPQKPAVPRPAARAPVAEVSARHGGSLVSRSGRGFSLAELAEAPVADREARRWGLSVDYRRRSKLSGNVAALKKWLATAKPDKPKPASVDGPSPKKAPKKKPKA